MRVLITGGAGFLGTLLARRLLADPPAFGGGPAGPVDELTLLDPLPPAADLAGDPRVRVVAAGLDTIGELRPVDAIFHLAGVVSGAAEVDFDLGLRTNLDGTRAVLDWARAHPVPPILVFTSSLAVFGQDPALAGPNDTLIDDDTLPRPQSSYGFQKFIGEQLVADYTRRGYLRGRSVRLMTVAVRPGRPNAAASGFLSGLIREPVHGQATTCPVPPDLPVALSSPGCSIEGIVTAAAVSDDRWGSTTAMTLPGLSTTPAQLAAGLDRVVGPGTSKLISWTPDPAIVAIVGRWPARFRTRRAAALGLRANEDVDSVIREFLGRS
jgi:nucleoside-diphosphate-sugar epimerase